MNTMRKFFALSMLALLALTLAVAGCGQQQAAEEAPAATETHSDATTTDTTAMSGMDTTATMAADTAASGH